MFYPRGSRLISKIQSGLVSAKDGDGEGGSGGGDEKWYSTMPEDMQAWEEVSKAEKPEDFYKYVGDMRSHLGQSIRIPGEDAGAEDLKAFNDKLMSKVPNLMSKPNLEDTDSMNNLYDSLGRPGKAEEYTMPEFKDVENLNTAPAEQFKELAHRAGLSNQQYNEVVRGMTQGDLDLRAEAADANKVAHEALAKEWGAEYKRRLDIATGITKLTDAPKEFQQLLASSDATPETYKWLYSLATKFKGEGTSLLQDTNTTKVSMTPADAASKITEIRNNKQHPYWDKLSPGHTAAMKKMKELYTIKAGE